MDRQTPAQNQTRFQQRFQQRQKLLTPFYIFKVVKGKGKTQKTDTLEACSSYTIVKQWDEDLDEQAGWELLLTRKPPLTGEVVRLPQDGHTVYVENAAGKTVMTFRWPEKSREAVLRVMDDQESPS